MLKLRRHAIFDITTARAPAAIRDGHRSTSRICSVRPSAVKQARAASLFTSDRPDAATAERGAAASPKGVRRPTSVAESASHGGQEAIVDQRVVSPRPSRADSSAECAAAPTRSEPGSLSPSPIATASHEAADRLCRSHCRMRGEVQSSMARSRYSKNELR